MTILLIALAIVIAAGLPKQPSSGQQRFPPSNRKPACGCYVCGLLLAVNFPNAAKDCAGILATDACPEALSQMPPEARAAACQQLKTKSKGGSLDECMILKHACDTGENPLPPGKCEPSRTPWFDPGGDCKDSQRWQIAQTRGVVTVLMCGEIVFTNPHVGTDPIFSAAFKGALRDALRESIGDTVCCDKFRDAVRSGSPCDPRNDIDCDGKPNTTDDTRRYPNDTSYNPDINIFKTSKNASIDPFPWGMNLGGIYPTAESCKDCQWELVKGELKCNVALQEGARHVYQAKWRCPTTGVEVDTFKYAAASEPCQAPQ